MYPMDTMEPMAARTHACDEPNDVYAATTAGVRLVAVATGRSTAEELREAGATTVLDDLSEPGPSAGRANVKAWFDRWKHAAAGAKTTNIRLVAVGDDVLAETLVIGRLQAPLGRLRPSDRPFAVHRAAIVQVRNDRIARLTFFMNTKELAEDVGQWPPSAAK